MIQPTYACTVRGLKWRARMRPFTCVSNRGFSAGISMDGTCYHCKEPQAHASDRPIHHHSIAQRIRRRHYGMPPSRRGVSGNQLILSDEPIAVSDSGRVTCPRRLDEDVCASLGALSTRFTVLCRPIKGFSETGGLDRAPRQRRASVGRRPGRRPRLHPRGPGLTDVALDRGDCVWHSARRMSPPFRLRNTCSHAASCCESSGTHSSGCTVEVRVEDRGVQGGGPASSAARRSGRPAAPA